MEEAARIQASLSSDLVSSMYKNKVPQQIEEKGGDYKKYRFKECHLINMTGQFLLKGKRNNQP